MRVRLLGVHNAESATERLAGVLVDGRLALDAGSLTRSLTRAEQERVRHVFLTHRHYDHLRDVPALAYGTPQAGAIHVYGLPDTLDALAAHLLNDVIYAAYHRRFGEDGAARVVLRPLAPRQPVEVLGHVVTPVPAFHTCPAVGYMVESDGRALFYTGDTGPGFAAALAGLRPPDLLLAESTYGSAAREDAVRAGHLTPELLRQEVRHLTESAPWRPRVVVLHMNPAHQAAIEREVALLRTETGWDAMIGDVGMELDA